jgi:MYXO-CTERM domain-containing protein
VDPGNQTHCGCETDSDCGTTTSGRVCDTADSQTCIDGCRGTDGNGCPSGQECTSKDSSIGQCIPIGENLGGSGGVGDGPDMGDDGNCGCRVPGTSTSSVPAALLALAGLGLLGARRRRRARG